MLLAFGFVATTAGSERAAIVVDDDGVECAGASYTSIQQAVEAAAPGDTIRVCPGVYRERVRITEPLILLGAQAGVDARGRSFGAGGESVIRSPAPLRLLADAITVDGFTLRVALDEDREGQGIFTYGSGYRIVNTLFENDEVAGITLTTIGSEPTRVARNQFRGRLGIAADGDGSARVVAIEDNLFRNASIRLVDGATRDVTIARNVFRFEPEAATACVDLARLECRPSLYIVLTRDVRVLDNELQDGGVYALRARGNQNLDVIGNRFTGGAGDGVQLADAGGGTTLADNRFQGYAGAAIRLEHADAYLVSGNRIAHDTGIGIEADEASAGNTVRANEVAGTGSGTLACRDMSRGDASFGTANTWEDNAGERSEPAGLCGGAAP